MGKNYYNLTAELKKINATEAETLLNNKPGTTIYIGRASCAYCRKFVLALSEAQQEINNTIHYINSEDAYDIENISKLRESYNIRTVPGLMHYDGMDVKVRCDSSMTIDEIINFVN